MTERELIRDRLEWIAANFAFDRFVFGFTETEPINRPLVQPWARLILIMDGTRNVTLGTATGTASHRLAAGDAYYILPGGWEAYQWNTVCRMMCIIPRFTYIRFSYYDQRRENQAPPVPAQYHTGTSYGREMRATIEALNAVARNGNTSGAAAHLARALVCQGLHELIAQPAQEHHGKRQATFDRIHHWLENCFAEDINRETTANQFGITPSYLSRLFRDMTGVSFHQHLTALRIEHAKNLLGRTSLTVKEVADQCGFRNPVHFVRRFREINGLSPGRYRQGQSH